MKTFLEEIKTEIRSSKAPQSENYGGIDFRGLLLTATGGFTQGYHLEFSSLDIDEARALCDAFAEHDIFANITHTRTLSDTCAENLACRFLLGSACDPSATAEQVSEKVRVYIKDSESICNLLALVGANKSLYKLNNQIAMRDVRNTSNRRTNCDTANISRQIKTAANQIEIFTALKKSPKFSTLAPELQHTVTVRLENPTATYDELAAILKISKSGVVHRIKKLLKQKV